ncbi:MAG: PQQ-binding-like beta-propeller repeat protein, partial [Verrucomicrobiota bacterium]
MKLISHVLFFTFFAFAAVGQARTWTQQSTGRTIEADFVRTAGANVVLKMKGREVTVPVTMLVPEDIEFIRGQSQPQSSPSAAAGADTNSGSAYLGPNRNGAVTTGKTWNWETDEPKILWQTPVGEGHSSTVVDANNNLYTQGWDKSQNREVVYAIDAITGEIEWTCETTPARMHYDHGSGATPAIDGNRIYALHNSGQLLCINAENGDRVWATHLIQDHGGQPHDWGYAGTPLVAGDVVIVDAGGSGSSTIAFNKTNGEPVWASGDFPAGYASPIPAEVSGKDAVLVFKYEQLVALDISSGRELFEYPKPGQIGHAIPTPILSEDGDSVFFGQEKISLGASPRQRWQIERQNFLNTPSLHAGHLYDMSDRNANGPLVCRDFDSGEVVWTESSITGPGDTLVVDNTLVVYLQSGELIIGNASPDGFN